MTGLSFICWLNFSSVFDITTVDCLPLIFSPVLFNLDLSAAAAFFAASLSFKLNFVPVFVGVVELDILAVPFGADMMTLLSTLLNYVADWLLSC